MQLLFLKLIYLYEYIFSLFLHNIIHNNIPEGHGQVKNSYHLVDKLNGMFFDPGYTLVSLNMVSLFINVP